MKRLTMIGLISAALVQGCSSAPDYVSQTSMQATSIAGQIILADAKADDFIAGKYDHPAILVNLTNTQKHAVRVSLSDITVLADGTPVNILTPEALTNQRASTLRKLTNSTSNGINRGSRSVATYSGTSSTPSGTTNISNNAYTHEVPADVTTIVGRYQQFVDSQLPTQFELAPGETKSGYLSFELDNAGAITNYEVSISTASGDARTVLVKQ